jgi:hypothetical protein
MFSGFFCKAPLQQSMELHCSLRGLNLFIFLSFVSFCHSVAFWKLLFLFFCKVLTSLSFGLDGAANFHEVKRRRDRKKEVRFTFCTILWFTDTHLLIVVMLIFFHPLEVVM